ncbi:MAG: hydroxylamine reductase [bacterium]|nr:hydroxylamine reductase [bacterium]
MFCFQCQEAAGNTGCKIKGVCGKADTTSNLQDLLIFALKGISVIEKLAGENDITREGTGRFITDALFTTITNANFSDESLVSLIEQAFAIRDELKSLIMAKLGDDAVDNLTEAATWTGNRDEYAGKALTIGVLSTSHEDVRSLRELLIYGLKGIAAYSHHAAALGHEDETIYSFLSEALAATTAEHTADELVGLNLRAGEVAVTTMALLDTANTSTYGNPEITEVNIGVGDKPGILISGHDLKDLEDLLEQTRGTGIDVYTHSEMLPAHYYPTFKKYDHLVGNYGGAWYDQKKEFASFNGPILMTTNCMVPITAAYADRIFTTGMVAYPDVPHIADAVKGQRKDFSAIIKRAKGCQAPSELESGKIVGGFAHNQVLALADKVVDAVKTGAIKRFVVMAGCDGRQKTRSYFTEVAEKLPEGTVILTAGCAKYRYNKLELGDIGGIPRVLDAGQCNDSYSLAVIALKLKEVFALDDINDLPLSFDIAWYEQKAVAVLLALLHLGVKGIRLGPTLPAFLSPNVAKVLVENFDIKGITDAESDIAAMMEGK